MVVKPSEIVMKPNSRGPDDELLDRQRCIMICAQAETNSIAKSLSG
jgi:hypothetical protein